MANTTLTKRILSFWFGPNQPCAAPNYGLWFGKNVEKNVDQFHSIHQDLCNGKSLGPEPADKLANIIVLDQFSRDLFKDQRMFQCDSAARKLSYQLVPLFNTIPEFGVHEWTFAFMPLMHSEELQDQEQCVGMFKKLLDQYPEHAKGEYKFAVEHCDIIRRFQRFPHRNAILGRQSTEEETEFLKTHKGF